MLWPYYRHIFVGSLIIIFNPHSAGKFYLFLTLSLLVCLLSASLLLHSIYFYIYPSIPISIIWQMPGLKMILLWALFSHRPISKIYLRLKDSGTKISASRTNILEHTLKIRLSESFVTALGKRRGSCFINNWGISSWLFT